MLRSILDCRKFTTERNGNICMAETKILYVASIEIVVEFIILFFLTPAELEPHENIDQYNRKVSFHRVSRIVDNSTCLH